MRIEVRRSCGRKDLVNVVEKGEEGLAVAGFCSVEALPDERQSSALPRLEGCPRCLGILTGDIAEGELDQTSSNFSASGFLYCQSPGLPDGGGK